MEHGSVFFLFRSDSVFVLMLEHQFIGINGITLHVVTAGPKNGPPVILLHGFPDFWFGWHRQIKFLAENGYRVIVPDQRGYNLSDKPKGIRPYHLDCLVHDIVGLIDYFGQARLYLVGHDWGAVVSWWLATRYPERLKKLVILNVPYISVAEQAAREGNWRQFLKSWYFFFFQIPWIPELLLRTMNRHAPLLLEMSSHPTTFNAAEKARFLKALQQPGALTGMVNWYRALRLVRGQLPCPMPGMIEVPTLILWGEQDVALEKVLAEKSLEVCQNGRLIFFPEATHWVHHDESDAVNNHLLNFLQ